MRVLAFVGLGVLGVVVACAGALVQDGWFPGGLLLALAAAVALFHGGAVATRSRLGAAVPVILWFVTVMYLSVSRPEGDFLFAAGAGPYVYLLGGMVAGVICATLPRRSPGDASGARLGR
ncbi:DUF6113 family protein [Streptomyces sp. PTM05]|uniref:DUF6113 family protein n=1 Tax=Streptantibioticus parmotrematis TaxID=2873249 RepID=A0ABS7QLS6_9ACTN|nr:DUF6113 family protein [Streptantibioticus parmotrematis]MBY8884142.1 DUF6113 family protein [Streptantibioticus parmotrematis]